MEVHSDVAYDLSPKVASSDLAELVWGNSDFAFALYRELSGGTENLFYSPYSISLALAMTYAGAANRTADQMAQALRFTLPQERLHPAFNQLALELAGRSAAEGADKDKAFRLNVANSLWGQTGYEFRKEFLDTLARNYGAGMRLTDFQADPEAARLLINDWVLRETQEKIEEIIPPGVIDTITRLVLANAVYFKASWQEPFDPDVTQDGAFKLLDGSTVTARMMGLQTGLRSMQGTGYRAVEIPYVGGQLSMLILLPDEGKFQDVEGRLDRALAEKAVSGLQPGQVYLSMPKFKFEWMAARLTDDFASLGMVDAFTRDADFSGMDGTLNLFIQAILHKAFVGVDEFGTEAAAATVVIMRMKSGPVRPTEFRIDRPFFFLIRDNPTGTILFLGRVTNPVK